MTYIGTDLILSDRGAISSYIRPPKALIFAVYGTQWEGERDTLNPITQAEAKALYEQLPEHEVEFEDAFPGVEVVEA
jgi:hypothetical protein